MEALLKVRKIGDGVGLILPEEVLAHLGVQIGDSLEVETTTHGILLRALRKP
jgi:antitoxin component of MazEF toxin-antitoxin module